MNRTPSVRNRRNQGFTLVEMLVVLAILVLLVGMVAPRVLKSQKKADRNNAKAQLGMFRSCLDRYALDMKDYPTTEQGLQALVRAPEGDATAAASVSTEVVPGDASQLDSATRSSTSTSTSGAASAWDGPYVNQESIPKDPWGNDYHYEYPPTHGTGEYPDIWSSGPDGQDGTEDDVVSWSNTDGSTDATSSGSEPTTPSTTTSKIDE